MGGYELAVLDSEQAFALLCNRCAELRNASGDGAFINSGRSAIGSGWLPHALGEIDAPFIEIAIVLMALGSLSNATKLRALKLKSATS